MTVPDPASQHLTPNQAQQLLAIANDLPVDQFRSVRTNPTEESAAFSTSVFTPAERSYLETQTIGRIATTSAMGRPDVAPVRYELVDDIVVVSGIDPERTIKFRNIVDGGLASFVVDDMISEHPWLPRGLKLTGAASIKGTGSHSLIEVAPDTVWSWAINSDADTYFGPIERRTVPVAAESTGTSSPNR